MFTKFLLISLALALTSCSLLSPITSMFSKKPSVEVNANLGKNINTDKSVLKVETGTTNQSADKISNDTAYTADTVNQITNNLTPLQLLLMLLCAGAALPSFKEMYVGVKIVIADILQTFIVYPLKSLKDFVMTLRKPKL